jgi:predicted Zn-dependent protease
LGLPTQQILNLGGTAAQLIFLRHSREDELEADKLGVEYSAKAGYDPRKVEGFFRALSQMGEKEGAGLPNFLQTHPSPANRIQRIQQLTAGMNLARRQKEIDPAAYYDAIERITLGEDPRQGFVEGGVFYHPELQFRFPVPQGFKVANQASQVIMIDNQQRAMIGLRLTGEKSAQSAASKFASQGGIRVLESGRTQSDGLPAALVVADAQAQNNQVVRVMAYFVEHDGRVYNFIGYTSPQVFGAFRNEFLRTMRGFGRVSDPEILRRQPVRLAVEPAPRTAPFRQLIPTRLPKGMTPEDVAILNQVGLNEEIRSGTLLKLPSGS